MPFQRIRFTKPSSRMLLCVMGILLILLLAGCDAVDPSTNAGTSPTPSVNAGTPNTDDATPTVAPTDTPTPVPTQPATPIPTPTSVIPFRITGVNATASPSSYSGLCNATKTITLSGTIYAPANSTGGTVTYEWTHSDNSFTLHHTVTFAPGVTAMTVSATWALNASQGNGTKLWGALKTLTPEVFISSHATFSFTCKREVVSASARVAPTTCTALVKIFAFTGTITLSASSSTSSVTVTYAWKRSNGTSKSYTVTVPAGQTSVVVTPDSWTLAAKGTYTDEIVTSSPNAVTSNKATVTCP